MDTRASDTVSGARLPGPFKGARHRTTCAAPIKLENAFTISRTRRALAHRVPESNSRRVSDPGGERRGWTGTRFSEGVVIDWSFCAGPMATGLTRSPCARAAAAVKRGVSRAHVTCRALRAKLATRLWKIAYFSMRCHSMQVSANFFLDRSCAGTSRSYVIFRPRQAFACEAL
jgi:hypothetical protein